MMNYLKKFESFQTHDEIHKICKQYNINNYTINSDGSIDVDGDVNLHFKMLKRLPLKFNHVSGDFWCSINFLTTLEGAPQSVSGNFICSSNYLTTLEGAPQSVSGDFICSSNNLTTLEGAPQSVGGSFLCSDNKLTTLEGAPQSVSGIFNCSFNEDLKSLKYLPIHISTDETDEVNFKYTAVYEIFKLLDNFSLGAIRYVNDLELVVDGKIDIEILNELLYDLGKPPVENVKGYDNI